jgi:plasmid stabilization system protein ParE
MLQVVWSPTASKDLDWHYNFLLTQDAITASKALREIIQTGGSLASNPYRGAVVQSSSGLRKLMILLDTRALAVVITRSDSTL